MRRNYRDITAILGDPLWYDEGGAPRYVAFHPAECDPQALYAALFEVACAKCAKSFAVAATAVGSWMCADANGPGMMDYRYPPFHGCEGDPMACVTLRIIQFWSNRDNGWSRDERSEFEYAPEREFVALVEARALGLVARPPVDIAEQRIVDFVNGAKSWEYHKTGATMWQSDQRLVEDLARRSLFVGPNADGLEA